LNIILAIAVYCVVGYALFFNGKARRKSPEAYRRERAYRRAEKAAARYMALPAAVRQTRRARFERPAPVVIPDFVQDVEAALLNIEYSKKQARQCLPSPRLAARRNNFLAGAEIGEERFVDGHRSLRLVKPPSGLQGGPARYESFDIT
jgi:hypothetical protein